MNVVHFPHFVLPCVYVPRALLLLGAWAQVVGVQDIGSFDFVSPPQTQALAAALARLSALGAVDLRSSSSSSSASAAAPIMRVGARQINRRKDGNSAPGNSGDGDTGAAASSLATLTPHGRRMALLPLSPVWAHTLLLSPQFGCVAEALTCAALLSVEPVLLLPSTSPPISSSTAPNNDSSGSNSQEVAGSEKDAARAAAAAAHRTFTSPDGDLPTLLNVYNAFWAVEAKVKHAAAGNAPATKATVVFKGDGEEDDDGENDEGKYDAKAAFNENSKTPQQNRGSSSQSQGSTSADVAARRRWAIAHHVSWRALLRAGQVCAVSNRSIEFEATKLT